MAKPENTLKRYLVRIMGTRWHTQSHEDQFSEGIPDLSFGSRGVNGWIELKFIEKYPIKLTTPIKPKKYTPEQVNWLTKRGKKGGLCWVLVKVAEDFFLFSFGQARRVRAGMTREEYRKFSVMVWTRSIDPDQFIEVITDVNLCKNGLQIKGQEEVEQGLTSSGHNHMDRSKGQTIRNRKAGEKE